MSFNKRVLDRTHEQLDRSVAITNDPLKCDRWVTSSLLQKSIRRGNAELARRAAFKLLDRDRIAIWRRLVSIAFEDIGAGDIDVLLETVRVSTSSELRRTSGEVAVLGSIVRRLAEATKDRSADYLACAAKEHSDLSNIRDFCRKASLEQRLQFLADTSQPLAQRGVPAWFASGINWRYDQQVRGGDIRALAARIPGSRSSG
jgi:replication-associated recombination protein RarA